jgi:hypothetical protein
MFQFCVATEHRTCQFLSRAQECLGTDRCEAAAQERPKGRRIARGDLREHELTGRDQPQGFPDESPSGAALLGAEHLDRQLQAVDQPSTDRDQSGGVTVYPYVAAMRVRP